MADPKTKTAPAQHKQPSRKGKKAWRKNVDTTQIETGLDDVREQIIQGGVISEKPSDELFAVDTAGSDEIRKQVAKRVKPLKVDEILAQRSAIPAVSSKKRLSDFDQAPKKKKAKISAKEYDRLRALAYGGDQVQKDVVQTGQTADYDPWAIEEKKQDPQFSFLEEKKPIQEPTTLKHAPISLHKDGKAIPAVRKPQGGKSYNPNFNDWQDLITREGDKAIEAEKQRLAEAREEEARMERAMAAMQEESDSEANESAWESEWEGFSEDEDSSKKKRPERKTPSQRNKIKRRKEAERKARHEAKMKEKEAQTQRIKELAKSVEAKEKAREDARAAVRKMALAHQEEVLSDDEEEVLRKRRFGKHHVPEAPLEVVLPDELQDSLRRLKPEGNLLKDRFRTMMIQGKVEARKKIPYAKKKKVTVTEKWSYKDWKLE